MSNSKNSFRGILRRALAQLLAFLMIFGLAMSGMGVQNAYATELQPGGSNNGATEATAFEWISATTGASSEGDSIATKRFDIHGLDTGQHTYTAGSIQTTWSHRGYATWVVKADSPTASAPSASSYFSLPGYKALKPSPNNNGDVVTDTNLGVEYRMLVSPGPDGRSVIVDYYLHNTTNTTGRFWIGSGADSMINGDDNATCFITPTGFHMVNRTTLQTFDLITNDSNLGLTPPDKRWVGHYYDYWKYMFVGGGPDRTNNIDSGVGYSWQIDLHPYETVHRRVAFLIKATSYYVNSTSGNDSGQGTYEDPFATLQHAVDKLAGKKGYIYIQNYNGAPVTLSGSGSTDVVIATTDYEKNSTATPYTGPTVEITSSTPGTPLFTQTGSGKYTIEKLILKGGTAERSTSLISVTGGTLRLGDQASVQDSKIGVETAGAAVNINGGTLQLEHGSSVSGNVSKTNGRGAINFETGALKLAGSKPSGASVINVTGNTDGEGKPRLCRNK